MIKTHPQIETWTLQIRNLKGTNTKFARHFPPLFGHDLCDTNGTSMRNNPGIEHTLLTCDPQQQHRTHTVLSTISHVQKWKRHRKLKPKNRFVWEPSSQLTTKLPTKTCAFMDRPVRLTKTQPRTRQKVRTQWMPPTQGTKSTRDLREFSRKTQNLLHVIIWHLLTGIVLDVWVNS